MNRYMRKAPNSKIQAPMKFQTLTDSKCRPGASPSPRGEGRGEGKLRPRLRARFNTAVALAFLLASPLLSHAFCGFYVAKADTTLFNKASQVVLVRNGDKTVLTMANDYQ